MYSLYLSVTALCHTQDDDYQLCLLAVVVQRCHTDHRGERATPSAEELPDRMIKYSGGSFSDSTHFIRAPSARLVDLDAFPTRLCICLDAYASL